MSDKRKSEDKVKSHYKKAKKDDLKYRNHKKSHNPKKNDTAIDQKISNTLYRDRAKERREGAFDFDFEFETDQTKGLDKALLRKVKADQENAEKNKQFSYSEVLSDGEDDEEDGGMVSRKSAKFIHCNTVLARRILELHEKKWPSKSELFLPGRMSYIIHLENEDVPVTTIIKSKLEK